MSTGLLFVLVLYVRVLSDSLSKCNLWLCKIDCNLVYILKFALNNFKMHIAYTIKKSLPVLWIIYNSKSLVFCRKLGKWLRNLINISLVLCMVSHGCIWCWNIHLCILYRICLCWKSIISRNIKLLKCTEVTCMKLRNFSCLVALKNIELTELNLYIFSWNIHCIIWFKYTWANLDKWVLTNEWIDHSLKYKGCLWLWEIKVSFKNLICIGIDTCHLTILRARHVFNYIIQKCVDTLTESTWSHLDRNNTAVTYITSNCCSDLSFWECISVKVSVHKLFWCLSYWFKKSISKELKVCLVVLRNFTFHYLFSFPSEALFLNYVYISNELFVFTDRQIERSHFLTIFICKILNYLSVWNIIDIHICYKEHTWNLVFFTEFPSFLSSNFDTGRARNNDYSCICNADSFLNLTYKIKESRSIQNIDLVTIPLERNGCCTDWEVTFLFFLIEIT